MASVVLFFFSNTNFQNTNKLMINQNELRIGNIIYFPFISDNVKVVGLALVENDKKIRIQTTVSGSHNFFELAEKYKPIPLTEEWLLNLGFECIAAAGDTKKFALKNRNKNYFK
jgi:hypothetical protein